MIYNKTLFTTLALTSLVSFSALAGPNQQDITLTGAISAVSCEVVLNGGSATLNVGTFQATAFNAVAKQVGDTPLVISLNNCTTASAEESGAIYVQGKTADGSNNIFVSDVNSQVGFMLTDDKSNPVVNNQPVSYSVTKGTNSVTFKAGMGALTTTPTNGVYSAPIVVAYVSD